MVSMQDILKQASLECPDKYAVVSYGKKYSFKEMDDASSRIAHFLISAGNRKGDRIGIFSTKNIEEILVLYAILKIGAIFVHINPFFREDQVRHIVIDCGIKTMFVHNNKRNVFNKALKESNPVELVINMTNDEKVMDTNKTISWASVNADIGQCSIKEVHIDEDDPAAIIYTSGSTGMQKGIIVTHKILHDSTVVSAEVLNNSPDDRIISMTPFSFDGALSQLFTSVLSRATLILQQSTFPKDIVSTMISEKISGFHGVPTFWRMLLQKHSPLSKHQFPFLRYISIIGEAISKEDVFLLQRIFKKTDIYLMYGTTEAFRSTYLHPGDLEKKFPSVGKPFPGVQIKIVNEQGEEVLPGEIGEIVHQGCFISPGYWNKPEKTDLVFKNNAVYTGDFGKKDIDGYVYVLGRMDSMIKVRGFRVSPDEIEQAIYKLDGIEQVCIIGVNNDQHEIVIKAVVVCSEGFDLKEDDIARHCHKLLPFYMIPSKIEFRKEMPRTGTFKINRSQLIEKVII